MIRGVRVNLAAAICWESYMPMLRQALYAQNVNLYLAPTADGRDAWLGLMRTVGIEGRCFVVSSNMCVRGGGSGSGSHSSAVVAAEENGDGGDVSPYQQQQPSRRRNSVLDEDGNEIVLPSDGKAAGDKPPSGKVNGLAKASSAGQVGAAGGKFISRGGSCITNPFGDVLAGPQWEDDEGIIYADVDFKDCIRGRLDYDAGGSYSR